MTGPPLSWSAGNHIRVGKETPNTWLCKKSIDAVHAKGDRDSQCNGDKQNAVAGQGLVSRLDFQESY
jgi:hypothetical protein